VAGTTTLALVKSANGWLAVAARAKTKTSQDSACLRVMLAQFLLVVVGVFSAYTHLTKNDKSI
jgi:DMSO reductase anchor subunit